MSTELATRPGAITPGAVGVPADPNYWVNPGGVWDEANDPIQEKMEVLVKGAGYAREGGNQPLTDDDEIFKRSMRATAAYRAAIHKSITEPGKVAKQLSPEFGKQFSAFAAAAPQNQGLAQLASQMTSALNELGKDVGKSFTLTSPLSSGFVPFDLVAPSRLIYPVYTPLRNKLPRVPGQGTSRRVKVITGISGSQTGTGSTGNFIRLGIPELVQASGGLSTNWPLNLPGSGSQSAVDLNVPYRFWGLTEALSWLAQFEGQGLV